MANPTNNEGGILTKIENHLENVTFPKNEKRIQESIESYQRAQNSIYSKIDDLVYEYRKEYKQQKKDEKAMKHAYNKVINELANDQYEEGMYLDGIEYAVEQLNKSLDKLDKTDSKIKAYYEEKKAAHEIRKILNYAGKCFDYEDDEMAAIEEYYSTLYQHV